MAQLAIAAAGAAAGFAIGGPGGAQIGWAVGSMVGAQFGPKQKSSGPRLEDLKVTGSEYGQTIPWAAGHPRLAGQVWWASNRREISTTTSAGGKGGGGAESTSYTYEVDILYGFAESFPAVGVSRVWSNGKLVYCALEGASDSTIAASNEDAPWDEMRFYDGGASQLPDPVYEANVANAPAYRGRITVMLEGLQLGSSGVIPNLTFEFAQEVAPGAETVLLMNFDGTLLEEISGQTFTNGSTTFAAGKFSQGLAVGGTSPGGGGGNGIQSSSDSALWDLNTSGDFTIRGWMKFHTQPIGRPRILIRIASSSGSDEYTVSEEIGSSGLKFFGIYPTGVSASANIESSTFAFSTDYFHLEFSREADTYRLFVNGISQGTASNAYRRATGNKKVFIGNRNIGFVDGLDGMIDSLQIVRGAALHTASFTPPTEPHGLLYQRLSLVDQTLQETVERLCEAAGMPAGTYDATALASITKPVRAFALSQVATTRSAIEQLMSAYFFEAYVTDKLYFVPRAGSAVDTIDADDMGAGLESPEDETLPTQVGSDLEIPAQVSVSYANVDADYTTATEHSDRLLSGQVSTSVVQLPLGFTAAEGKGIADAIVVDGYASRVTGSFSVPLAYAALTPTDVVAVPDADGNVYRVRIVRRTDEGPLLKFEWVLDDATAIESAGITSDDYTPTVDVALPGETIMQLMDVPLMRDAENTLGHYVAATSSGTTWPGASISRSLDDVEFAEAARVSERAILGVTTTTLGNYTGVGFDERNTVTVSLSYGTLSSSTRAGLLADASINNIMIGAELVRFRTATFVSTGVYTLSGLLRGQKGTEWAMAGHTSTDVVVLIQTAGIRYVAIDLPSLSAERFYKGVTLGKSLASVTGESFTCEGVSLMPLAPVNLRRTVGTGNQITVTWNRRTRLACTFTGAAGISVPLGELTEAYEVDVVLIAGSVLKRTLSVTSASAIYTAAMQTADGIGASTPIRFDVYQMSAVVGRGYVASLTTAGAVTPLPQITTLTVGGSFATGAALYATLGGVTYNYTSVGGDTNLDGIATSFAAVIDAASAYTAAAVGAVITVTGAVSAAFPVVAGVSAGDNTATWSLTQTASATVAGVSNQITMRWLNLGDPAGSNAYPLGMTMYALVQRISPPLNLTYSYVTTPSGRTNYEVLPIAAAAIQSAFNASGDAAAYGLSMTLSDPGVSQLSLFTPAAEPYNWTVQAISSVSAVSGLVGDIGSGVTPATLRPQIVTLTLAGTPVTGRVYRATLGGVPLDYTATGGDTTMALVAAGLAGVIDAHSDYLASAAGDVITITHASDNVPFTYSATVIASTVTLTAATTQEAA